MPELSLLRSLFTWSRIPSRRAIAALAKIHGFRLERRCPFLLPARGASLNLDFEDCLELQYCRTHSFRFLSVGAFDGVANDPLSAFVRTHRCSGVFIEPQPEPFARLSENYRAFPQVALINAAVDKTAGVRPLFHVAPRIAGLPPWTEQLASFDREHLLAHEPDAPGLAQHILSTEVRTITFDDLLNTFAIRSLDVLQIDAEGMDAALLSWFPFTRVRPVLLHYEIAHMTEPERGRTHARLSSYGYRVLDLGAELDELAVRF